MSRFRSELTRKKAYDRILRKINRQLSCHKLIIKGGTKVDASLTESPFNSKGATTYEIALDREEDQRDQIDMDKEDHYHKLKQARWLKKGKKITYGYKKHIGIDENGMVLGVHTTTANEHDSKGLEPLINKLNKTERKAIYADKGFKSKANDNMLKDKSGKSRIMHKAYRNNPLTYWQKRYNKLISKSRWVVE